MLRISVVLGLVVLVAGCTSDKSSTRDVVFLTREGCVNTASMRANLNDALRSLGRPPDYRVIDVGTLSESDARGGYGTPTVLYGGRDLFGMPVPPLPHPEPT